jgi:hypothetical protein
MVEGFVDISFGVVLCSSLATNPAAVKSINSAVKSTYDFLSVSEHGSDE